MLNLALADDFGIFNIFNLHLDSTVSELLCIDAYFVRGLIKGFLCRNILSIYLQLNLMDPGKSIIFLPNAEWGYRTKFEILLEGLFQYSIE